MPIDPRAYRMLEDRGRDSLDEHVRELMKLYGLDGFHCRNAIGSRRGFPDWEIWGREILHRELKNERRSITPDQRRVGSMISKAGGNWAVWRPRDFFSGVIEAELERIAW